MCPTDYCTDELDDHTLNDCGEELLGSSDAVVLLEPDHQLTNPSSTSQVNAEIAAGRAKLVTGVKVSVEAPSPIKVPSNVGGKIDKLVNYDRKGTLIDGNVNAPNVDFYNELLTGRTLGGMLIYEKGTEESVGGAKVTWIDADLAFTGGRILPASNTEFQRFETEFTWKKKTEGQIYQAPANIF